MRRALLLGLLVLAPVLEARATCPQVLADCFGAATGFKVVADKLIISRGMIGSEGFVSTLGSRVGDVCAGSGLVAGPACDRSTVRSLVLSAGTGIAGSFIGYPCPFDGTPAGVGVDVLGDFVSGGGRLRGVSALNVLGTTDTTGDDPRVATCDQARADMRSAAATLSALTPTRDLGTIRLVPANGMDFTMTLNADPGVNVWTADAISLANRKNNFSGEIHSTNLVIVLDPATESVVLNVRRVKVARYSALIVSDGSRVVLNVPAGGAVRNRSGAVEPTVLGPDASVQVKTNGETDNGPVAIYAGRVNILGAVVDP